ncbi:tRNA (guanosine(46)-N7)-methyltransferase TrmB [Luedemannella flava]|uniref:tRNA (guanine-N(7)-)-methyltransferase n=1 Tax=Luedemannella flava TaxID=349316 RepID=A0ABP4Y7Y9_9ACTN
MHPGPLGIVTGVTIPLDAQHHSRIRTFHPRRGRTGTRRAEALERLWPDFGLDIPADADLRRPVDPAAVFGRVAPVVLEIGCGMGDAAVAMAAADPDRDYLAVDVHTPGLGRVLTEIEDRGLTNLRAVRGDALDLVRDCLPAASLAAVHVFFPDPWPKARHHKRRLVQPAAVALLADRLAPGGHLLCATDWADYAEQMLEVLSAEPTLHNLHDGAAPRLATRPVTVFERRALAAGRQIADFAFARRP